MTRNENSMNVDACGDRGSIFRTNTVRLYLRAIYRTSREGSRKNVQAGLLYQPWHTTRTRPRTKMINRRMHDFIQVAWAIGNVAGLCKTKYRVSTPPYPKAILEVTLYPNPNYLKSRNGTWVAHLSALGCCASSTKGASEHTDLERVSSVVEASRASDVNVSRLLPAVCRATARVQ